MNNRPQNGLPLLMTRVTMLAEYDVGVAADGRERLCIGFRQPVKTAMARSGWADCAAVELAVPVQLQRVIG
jgi:hypothetical protein